jgi:hypothetical protein
MSSCELKAQVPDKTTQYWKFTAAGRNRARATQFAVLYWTLMLLTRSIGATVECTRG